MGFLELFLIGVGLSMDAFAVSVCKGLCMKRLEMGPCLDGGIVFRRLSGIDAPSGVGTWFAIFGIYPAV